MRVFIDSPHRLIQESLTVMIGRRHSIVEEANAEITIKDLCSYAFPYPLPSALPTLALICHREQDTAAVELLRIGYRGYLRVEDGEAKLEQALQALVRGENWAERHVLAAFFDRHKEPLLTPREREIYGFVLRGLSNQAISEQLDLSVNTIKVYLSRILQKLQAKTRRELIVRAAQQLKPASELIPED